MAYLMGGPFAQQFFDANGDPLENGTIEFYIWNTSTPTNIYSDSSGTSAGTSVTLNTWGAPVNGGGTPIALFFDTSVTYKIIRKTAAGAAIAPTIGPYKPLRADGVYAEDYATLSDAVTAAAGSELIITENTVVAANASISGCGLRFVYPGNLDPNTGVTVTVNAEYLVPSTNCFDKTALGVITSTAQMMLSGPGVSVLWFGAKGDGGTTDNLTAFTNARTMARANNAPVYVPGTAKFYKLAGTYEMGSRYDALIGDGPYQTVFWQANAAPCIKVTADYWRLEGFGVAGAATSTHGIQIGTAVANNTSAALGVARNCWAGWVGGYGWYLAGAISSKFYDCNVDTNNGNRPSQILTAPTLGAEQWQWYITGMATAGCNYQCVFYGCFANGGGSTGGIKIGDSGGVIQRLTWYGLLAQGNTFKHLEIVNVSHGNITGVWNEEGPPLNGAIWGITIDGCTDLILDGITITGDIRMINNTKWSAVKNGSGSGVYIDSTCGYGNVVENFGFGGLSSGPGGGKVVDLSNKAIIRDNFNNIGSEAVPGVVTGAETLVLATGFENWHTKPSTLPEGVSTIGSPTITKETSIIHSGAASVKVVAASSGDGFGITLPGYEQLKGHIITVEAWVRNVTTTGLCSMPWSFNSGAALYDLPVTNTNGAWERLVWSGVVLDSYVVCQIQFIASAAGTFYVDNVRITTDAAYKPDLSINLSSDAVPSLRSGNVFGMTPYMYVDTGSNITSFNYPMVGQEFSLIFIGNRTVEHGATIKLNGSANFVGTAGDILTLFYNGIDHIFYEKSRMVQ